MTDRLVALTIRQVSLLESRAYGHRGLCREESPTHPLRPVFSAKHGHCVSISPKSHGEHYEVKVAPVGVQSPT